ncbi:MAG TPA: CPCC family cysteine-rich protein [Xanthobacteraceae bacterium]
MCPVCWWEDDGQDEHDLDTMRGGPNGTLTLREARENYRRFGASEALYADRVRKPRPEEMESSPLAP